MKLNLFILLQNIVHVLLIFRHMQIILQFRQNAYQNAIIYSKNTGKSDQGTNCTSVYTHRTTEQRIMHFAKC